MRGRPRAAPSRPLLAARAPNHLGDGIMALPALRALARLGPLVIHSPPWGAALYRDIEAQVRPRGRMNAERAVLFAPSLRAALEALGCRERIGVDWDFRGPLLTRIVPGHGHRAEVYARCAEAAGARVEGAPVWTVRPGEGGVDVPEGHIGLNPVSVSGAVREWGAWLQLADRLDRPVVFYGGPGEERRVAAVAGPHPRRVGLDLPRFGAALKRCAVFVSNDSGAAHFARAVGCPTVVIHGSTAPSRTGPLGSLPVRGPALPCAPCEGRRCALGAARPPCLDIEVDAVLARIREALGE